MAHITESFGVIEVVSLSSRSSAFSLGDRVQLIFRPIDAPNPPYSLKVISPTGSMIVDTIIRSLPTGEPQSAPPFEFSPSTKGIYRVEIRESKTRAEGIAKLQVG
ncbi:MAG: hypothetical protein IPK82_18105 [Polyangiaceae bacterium]|nr:hypothetical protein [Polyangiaceae bacterium]